MVNYTSGNSNTVIPFNTYEIGIASGNPYSTKWKYSGTNKQFGVDVNQFEKDPLELPIELKLRGSLENIKETKNLLFQECEKDILQKTPGTFTVNDWSIQGYFLERETTGTSDFYGEIMSTVFFAPYPFWIRKIEKQFKPQEDITSTEGLDFPFDFAFDFAEDKAGTAKWYVDHFASSHFEMTIFGPCVNPKIVVNGYPYQINTTLLAGDYLIINSRNNSVIKHMANGTTSNLYNSREFKKSVFEKIPSGWLSINWTGTFGFDLRLFLERSEPKW